MTITSGRELNQQLAANLSARRFALSPRLVGVLHLAVVATLKGGGVDLEGVTIAPYQSAGEVITAVISEHIDVGVMNPLITIISLSRDHASSRNSARMVAE